MKKHLKLFAKQNMYFQIPKGNKYGKNCVFSFNCWKYSLVKEKQSLEQDSC